MSIVGLLIGIVVYCVIRYGLRGFYTVRPDERAVVTSFGAAQLLEGSSTTTPVLSPDEQERYNHPSGSRGQPGRPLLQNALAEGV